MEPLQNVSLRHHSTMRLGGPARHLAEVHSHHDLRAAITWATRRRIPIIMIGGGSNIVWRDEGFDGLVLVNRIRRFELHQGDDTNVTLTVGAGEPWDHVVERSVSAGLSGIEHLSLIPGTAGATPIQNVGAYGREVADVLVSVEVYDNTIGDFRVLSNTECHFGYRSSRFRTTDRGRFYVTGLTLLLQRDDPKPPFYEALRRHLVDRGMGDRPITSQILREGVIALRTEKLPSIATVANCGSFFANPIVDETTLLALQVKHSDIPFWRTDDGRIKLSGAWLIEHAGFKHHRDRETGMGTWPAQPLVLVNEYATSTAQLLAFQQKVVAAVERRFGVTLEREPDLLP